VVKLEHPKYFGKRFKAQTLNTNVTYRYLTFSYKKSKHVVCRALSIV
jgi:hypothetical protein